MDDGKQNKTKKNKKRIKKTIKTNMKKEKKRGIIRQGKQGGGKRIIIEKKG